MPLRCRVDLIRIRGLDRIVSSIGIIPPPPPCKIAFDLLGIAVTGVYCSVAVWPFRYSAFAGGGYMGYSWRGLQ